MINSRANVRILLVTLAMCMLFMSQVAIIAGTGFSLIPYDDIHATIIRDGLVDDGIAGIVPLLSKLWFVCGVSVAISLASTGGCIVWCIPSPFSVGAIEYVRIKSRVAGAIGHGCYIVGLLFVAFSLRLRDSIKNDIQEIVIAFEYFDLLQRSLRGVYGMFYGVEISGCLLMCAGLGLLRYRMLSR